MFLTTLSVGLKRFWKGWEMKCGNAKWFIDQNLAFTVLRNGREDGRREKFLDQNTMK
jgi:ribosome-associated protein YbcJ (S4-like RNA binding protein)